MFSKQKDDHIKNGKIKENYQVDTLIGISASIKGDIISQGNVRVDGSFNGSIISEKEVVIGEKSHITGNIQAMAIIIYGEVDGNIKSDGILEIMSTGKLYGDIEVKSISIKEGAIFQGKSSMNYKKDGEIFEEVAINSL